MAVFCPDCRRRISEAVFPRNRKLAEIFHRLKLIEAYGTGIRKIYALYKDCAVQPCIEVTPNTFKLMLPNMNTNPSKTIPNKTNTVLQMKTMLDYLAEYKEMTDDELQELLNIKKTRAYLLTRQMSENGLIEIVGRGAAKKYKLKYFD